MKKFEKFENGDMCSKIPAHINKDAFDYFEIEEDETLYIERAYINGDAAECESSLCYEIKFKKYNNLPISYIGELIYTF